QVEPGVLGALEAEEELRPSPADPGTKCVSAWVHQPASANASMGATPWPLSTLLTRAMYVSSSVARRISKSSTFGLEESSSRTKAVASLVEIGRAHV